MNKSRSATTAGKGHDAASTVIIGAGPTGLSAAYHLGEDSLLIEQNDRVGGWCRSIEDDGFTFDYAGHIMFSNDPYVHELYKMLLGDNVHWQDREAWIYSKRRVHALPVPGRAVRAAARGDQGVHRRRDRGALRVARRGREEGARAHHAAERERANAAGRANGHAATASPTS